MDAATNRPPRDVGKDVRRRAAAARALLGKSRTLHGALGFWQKINNDWVFNLAGLLAYNLLMAIFPILLVLLAISGIVVGRLSPDAYANLTASIGAAIPGGKGVVRGITRQLADSAGLLLLIGLLAALFTGSRLFISMEHCFAVIFRLRSRDPLHQNLMAFGMLLLFIVLVPVITLGSVAPAAIVRALSSGVPHGWGGFVAQALGLVASAVLAAVLFAAIYLVVPNRRTRPREIWRGTVVAAGLLALYEALFPLYESNLLHPGNYGHLAGYVVIVLVYFYYFALILLLGAEVNSWAAGERQTEGDIPAILRAAHEQRVAASAADRAVPAPGEA
ncbi:MAG TPA: YihY/virulence factor BrkB family protein [Ktedonobacterales bacterium]|nr:YihY/virulence factor BrkB family protein [Ktedonobacterales bacterium]